MNLVAANDFQTTVQNALERMAFVFAEPSLRSYGDVFAEARFHARIDIAMPCGAAALGLSATGEFLADVAAAMMGLDTAEIDIATHGDPVATELANVLGGELVLAMGGRDAAFRLGLPRTVAGPQAAEFVAACAADGQITVVEGGRGRLLLCWRVTG